MKTVMQRILNSDILITILIPLVLNSCLPRFDDDVFVHTDLVSVGDYVEMNKETYSKFYRIMVQGETIGAVSAHNPRGNGYTLFLPTDEAIDQYVQQNDSFADFEELMQDTVLVRFLSRHHVINRSVASYDFPRGELPGATASGDKLRVNFITRGDTVVYSINGMAPVINASLKMTNGFVHVISGVLKPIDFSGYEWLKENEGFSILTQAIDTARLSYGLDLSRRYTILAEHDSIYSRYGINSLTDLIDVFATPDLKLRDRDNSFFQYVAFHVLAGSYYMSDLEWGSDYYPTFSSREVKIELGVNRIRINHEKDTIFMNISEQGDTTIIDYVGMFTNYSDNCTSKGAVHSLSELLYFYVPPTSSGFIWNKQAN